MAKMVDVEQLKPLLEGVLTEDNQDAVIEGIMAITQDYDDEAMQARIDEAVSTAKTDSAKEYSAKLHDMFFGKAADADTGVIEDDTKVDETMLNEKKDVPDIFN